MVLDRHTFQIRGINRTAFSDRIEGLVPRTRVQGSTSTNTNTALTVIGGTRCRRRNAVVDALGKLEEGGRTRLESRAGLCVELGLVVPADSLSTEPLN